MAFAVGMYSVKSSEARHCLFSENIDDERKMRSESLDKKPGQVGVGWRTILNFGVKGRHYGLLGYFYSIGPRGLSARDVRFRQFFSKTETANSHISKTCPARVSKQLVGKELASLLLPIHRQTERIKALPILVRDVCLLQTSQPTLMACQKMEHNTWQWL